MDYYLLRLWEISMAGNGAGTFLLPSWWILLVRSTLHHSQNTGQKSTCKTVTCHNYKFWAKICQVTYLLVKKFSVWFWSSRLLGDIPTLKTGKKGAFTQAQSANNPFLKEGVLALFIIKTSSVLRHQKLTPSSATFTCILITISQLVRVVIFRAVI